MNNTAAVTHQQIVVPYIRPPAVDTTHGCIKLGGVARRRGTVVLKGWFVQER